MNDLNKLIEISGKIREFQVQRSDIKEGLIITEKQKNILEKHIEQTKLIAESEILYNTEFKNEAQRNVAIKQALGANQEYQCSLQELQDININIKYSEIDLGRKQIEVNALEREYSVILAFMQVNKLAMAGV